MSYALRFPCSSPYHHLCELDSIVVLFVSPYLLPFLTLTTFLVLFPYVPVTPPFLTYAFFTKASLWPASIHMNLVLSSFLFPVVNMFLSKVLFGPFLAIFFSIKCSFSHVKIVQSCPFKSFSVKLKEFVLSYPLV